LLESRHSSNNNYYYLSLENLMPRQWLNVKGPIVDANNRLNSIFNSFIPFSSEFSLENRLIDIFSSCFSFYVSNRKYAKAKKTYFCKLEKLILYILANPKTTIVVLDASIKNQVATSITLIHVHETSVIKTIHHAINITSTEAELFMIRYGLN